MQPFGLFHWPPCGSGFFCSGTLISTVNNDLTPYFLTANHCISTNAEANTAAVDWRAVGQVLGPDPATDAVTCLEDDYRLPALVQPAGGGEPGVPGADDAHVCVDPLTGHGACLLRASGGESNSA